MGMMPENKAKALFELASIEILKIWEIPNQYWPRPEPLIPIPSQREINDFIRYHNMREQSKWWLVKTHWGMIEIGWRKRVISIDWSDTEIQANVTEDQVTKTPFLVHADSEANAVRYLTELGKRFTRLGIPERTTDAVH